MSVHFGGRGPGHMARALVAVSSVSANLTALKAAAAVIAGGRGVAFAGIAS